MMRGLFTTLLQKAKDVYTIKIRLCKRKVCEGSQGGSLVKKLLDLKIDLANLGSYPSLCLFPSHGFQFFLGQRENRLLCLVSLPGSKEWLEIIYSCSSCEFQPM